MNTFRMKDRKPNLIDRVGGKANAIAMIVFFIISMAVGLTWIELEARKNEAAQYIASWPITTNRNIEWTWAGKDGAGR